MELWPRWNHLCIYLTHVVQSVERATPGEEGPDSILALYWLGWCQYNVTC